MVIKKLKQEILQNISNTQNLTIVNFKNFPYTIGATSNITMKFIVIINVTRNNAFKCSQLMLEAEQI